MRYCSINELSEITGKANPTIKKRLAPLDSSNGKYNSVEALPLIFEISKPVGEYDLEQERARLAAEQADGKAIDNAKKRRELVLLSDACEVVANEYEIIRKRLFICSDTVSTDIVADYELDQKEKHNVRQIVHNAINDALEELSADDEKVLDKKIVSIEAVRDSRKHT